MNKRIAKARIHERYNERLKKFRLIGKIIPLSQSWPDGISTGICSCLLGQLSASSF